MLDNLGIIFKLHRMDLDFKLRHVAEQVGVPASKLSDFENNRVKIPEKLLRNLYSVMGLNACFPEDAVELTKDIVLNLYHDVAFVTGSDLATFKTLLNIREQIMYTDAYITWILGDFIYHVYHYDVEFKYQLSMECLIKYESILPLDMKQILYDTVGVYLKNQGQLKTALEFFKMGKFLSISDTAGGMIYYHEAMIFRSLGLISEALISIERAKDFFERELNQKRSIMTAVQLGNVYLLLGKYDDAERIYLQCLEAVKFNPVGNVMILYNNLAWNSIVANQYEKSLYYAKEASKISNEFAGCINFYRAYASYKLGRRDDAKEFIKTAKTFSKNENRYMKSIIKAFSTFLSPKASFKTKEDKLLEAYKEAVKENDLQLQIFVLMIVIDLDFPEEEIQKEIDYRDLIIDLLQKRR